MKNLFLLSLVTVSSAWASYEDQFPQYFEYCTGSQVKYQPAYFNGAVGGKGGHGFMYIHGLCKDYTKTYPQVIPCSKVKNVESRFSHAGVGVSLDSDFKNVSWVAVPGRGLTMFGNLPRKEVTTQDIDQIIDESLKLKIFENVEMSTKSVNNLELNRPGYERAAVLTTIGTDVAVNLGRELRCVRIPVPPKAVEAAAEFLNAENNKYYQTGKKFEWSGMANNCTHLALNTSHAMGMNKLEKTDQFIIKQIFDIAIPANAYLLYADQAVLNKITNRELANSSQLKEFGYHPAQVGSLMLRYNAYPESVMFKTEDLTAITAPRKRILKMFATAGSYDEYLAQSDDENVLLLDNAKRWVKTYSSLLQKLPHSELNLDQRIYLEGQKDLSLKIAE